jgi:phenylpyruvate tautomerase PptA (4-oxalocrotonate tautomerase family)
MPYLKLQTNVELSKDRKTELLSDLISLVSKELNKPEKYVMTLIQDSQVMLFASSDEPLAYLEFRSIRLPEDQTKTLSKSLTHFIKSRLNIEATRIFIQFVNSDPHMWGFKSSTF